MRAYILTDNNMGVSAAFSKRKEMLDQVAHHLEDLENDREIQKALEEVDSACISINIEVAEITEKDFNEINSAP